MNKQRNRRYAASSPGETEVIFPEQTAPPPLTPSESACENFLAYACDGSLEGLLTAVFLTYARHEEPQDIFCGNIIQPRINQRLVSVQSDLALATRVKEALIRRFGYQTFYRVWQASCSDDPSKGTIIYRFFRYAFPSEKGSAGNKGGERHKAANSVMGPSRQILDDLAHPAVGPLLALARSVANEQERMRQFARFQHLEGGIWFARCNPKASVVPLLMRWFAERFGSEPFVLYDENHRIAGLYNGRHWQLLRTDSLQEPSALAEEAIMQKAWKSFYRSVSIEARCNPELRCHFMPQRLWKNLPEMQPE